MGRRAAGEGSLLRHGGKWRARIRWHGREYVRVAASKAEAKARLAELRKALDTGITPPLRAGVTLEQWFDEWLSEVLISRPRTWSFYRCKLRPLRAPLGSLRLTDLTAADVRHVLAGLSAGGMGATSVSHVYRTLHTCLAVAVRQRLLFHNPAAEVATPRRGDFEGHPLTEAEARRLLEVSAHHKLGPLIGLALATGMREGELLALTWPDVDSGQIRVNKTVRWRRIHDRQPEPIAGPPKTRSSRRVLTVDRRVVALLEDQRGRVSRMRLAAHHWQNNDLVFPTYLGHYQVPSGDFVRQFRSLLSKAQCPQIRFHDLRHTAGLVLTRHVGIVVASRMLGHSSPAITASFYGAAQTEDFAAAAAAMGELFEPSLTESASDAG